MIKKMFKVFALAKEIDKEDIAALRQFVLICKANGLTVVTAIRKIIAEFDKLKDELQD